MVVLKIVSVLVIFSVREVALFELVSRTADNYGPYITDLTRYEHCKGPKARDIAKFDIKNMVVGATQIGVYNLTFLEQTRIDDIKITVYTNKDNRKNILWTYKLNKPCQHFAVAAVVRESLKSDNNCVVKKGNYEYAIRFNDLAKIFFGDSFFYGHYEMKAVVLSKSGNIMCIVIYPEFKKRPNGKL